MMKMIMICRVLIACTCLSDMSEQKVEEEIGKKKYEEDDENPATGRGLECQ